MSLTYMNHRIMKYFFFFFSSCHTIFIAVQHVIHSRNRKKNRSNERKKLGLYFYERKFTLYLEKYRISTETKITPVEEKVQTESTSRNTVLQRILNIIIIEISISIFRLYQVLTFQKLDSMFSTRNYLCHLSSCFQDEEPRMDRLFHSNPGGVNRQLSRHTLAPTP